MIRTQIYLNDQQYHLAKAIAAQGEIGFSEFIRHGLDLALEENQGKKKKQGHNLHEAAGTFKTGPGYEHLWRDIDDIYDIGD